MTTIFLNYWSFSKSILLHKTFKFIKMFPNIQRTTSQIMNHMKYIYTKKSQENFINDKVQSSYVQCTLKEILKINYHTTTSC